MEGSLCGLCQKKDVQSRNCAISKEGSWHGLCQKKTYNRAVAQLANACGTKMTRKDCIRAIAQLRPHTYNTEQEVENTDTGKPELYGALS